MGISFKELKKNRLTPTEKWVLETIDGVEPITQPNGKVDWYKDGNYLFTQYFQDGYLDVVYSIWWGKDGEFGLSYNEMVELLTNLLYDYTDNGKLTII